MNIKCLKLCFVASIVFILSITSFSQYCTPTALSDQTPYSMYIDGVQLNNLSNTGTGGNIPPCYTDYTSIVGVLDTINQNDLIITASPGIYYASLYYHVWIDYNQDEDFDDVDEYLGYVQPADAGSDMTLSFSTPAGAAKGSTTLRIICVYVNSSLLSCADYGYGEAEDYTVTTPGFYDIGADEGFISPGPAEWVDYDGDGDLDLYFMGSYLNYGQIQRNDGGDNFTLLSSEIINVSYGNGSWGDYDNDGDLDIAITGQKLDVKMTKIYRNDGGTFTDLNLPLLAVDNSACAWGDYNNDGRLDLIVSGNDSTEEPVTILYRNDGNDMFTDSQTDITPVTQGTIEWGDFNNDENLDLLMLGQDFNGNSITEIYKNDGKGNFTSINAGFPGNYKGNATFGDYDNDGDLDVTLCGYGGNGRVFKNNSDDTFTDINAGLEDLTESLINWIDYDSDGDLDIIFSGWLYDDITYGSAKTYIYSNEGNDSFVSVDHSIIDVRRPGQAVGDYDNDGDLDLAITGYTTSGSDRATKLYRNESLQVNTLPTVPNSGFQSTVIHNGAVLSWDPATDNETPSPGLSYNIRIGTTSGAMDVLSPMSDLGSGKSLKAWYGNVGSDTDYHIKELPVGTYYWSVQAVDVNYKASGFSAEQSFEILSTVTPFQNSYLPLRQGAIAFGDYNNDGYVDFVTSGEDIVDGFLTRIYKNNGDFTFDTINAMLPGISGSSLAWGDYDNDSDLDLLLCGDTKKYPEPPNKITRVYRNDGSDVFTDINAGLQGTSNCDAEWGDIDNDGDLDFAFVGWNSSWIYRNEGNDVFTKINTYIGGGSLGLLSFGDLDNDYDLDLIVSGNPTRIWINGGGGNFVKSDDVLPSINDGKISFADFDNDGDLDLLFVGITDGLNAVTIFENSNGVFSKAGASFRGVSEADGFSGDFNNDGYQDVLYTGRSGVMISKLYLSEQNGTFSDMQLDLVSGWRARVSGADIDNDGDLDILISAYGMDSTTIYRNNMNFPKILPEAPQSTSSENLGLGVILNWDPPANFSGKEGSLSYNIRLGSAPGLADIISPMTLTPTSSKRLVTQMGNAQTNTGWRIDSLAVGKYYWSVQAIDNSYFGGDWAIEDSFTITQIRPYFSSNIVCMGDYTSFTDETIVTGTQIASWLWDFGDGNTSTLQHPKYVYGEAGNFTAILTVTDTAGVYLTKSNQVTVLPRPEAIFSTSDVCIGSLASVFNNSNTDTLNILTWGWDYGDGGSSIEQNPAPYRYYDTGAFDIKLSVAAQNGCSDSAVHKINVAEIPISIITAGSTPQFCDGDSVKLSVPENSNYTYQWKIGGVPIGGANASEYFASILGDHSVTVTNPIANCVSNSPSPATIVVIPAPTQPLIQANDSTTFCSGDSVELNVAFTAGYSYQWKLNGGAVGTNSNTLIAKNPGTYSLEVTNSTGCKDTSSNTIPVVVNASPSVPTVNLNNVTTLCEGDSVVLSVTNNPSLTYQWLNGAVTLDGENSNSYKAISSGSYKLSSTNSNGCLSFSSPVDILVNPSPSAPTISSSDPLSFCLGDSAILSVTNNTGITYQWKQNSGDAGTNTNMIVAKTSGTYNVVVTNSSNCSATATNPISVTVNTKPSTEEISKNGPLTFCQGDSVELSVGNDPSLSYQWMNGTSLISEATSSRYTARSTGKYSLKITNLNTCNIQTNPVTVTVNPLPDAPSIQIIGSTSFCRGDSVRLSVPITANMTYKWKIDNQIIPSDINSNIFDAKNSGTYSLQISNTSDCFIESSNTVDVIANELPKKSSILSSGYDPNDCPEERLITLSLDEAPSDYSYQWYYDDVALVGETESTLQDYLLQGVYSVDLNNNECITRSETFETRFDIPDKPSIIAEGPNIWYLACSNDNGTDYNWYFNDTEITGANDYVYIAGAKLGKYKVGVKEDTECYNYSDEIQIPLTTGIEEHPFANLKIYPNPTPGLFTLEMDNPIMGDLIIDIFGETGQQIINIKFQKETNHFKTQIDLSGQPAALYLINLMLNDWRTTRSLVVE